MKSKLLSSILLIAIVSNMAGCTIKISEDSLIEEPKYAVINESIENEDIQELFFYEYENINMEEYLNKLLYDEFIDYNLVINNYLNSNNEERLNLKADYLVSIYMLIINSHVNLDIYLEELNNLLIMSQTPMCLSDEEWRELFGNLNNLLKENVSLYEMFIPFAIYVHEINCDNIHEYNEYGSYTCDDLNAYKLIRV